MKTLVFSGIATSALLIAMSSASASDSLASVTPTSAEAAFQQVQLSSLPQSVGAQAGKMRGMGGHRAPMQGHMPKIGGNNGPKPGHMPKMGGNNGPRGGFGGYNGGHRGPRPFVGHNPNMVRPNVDGKAGWVHGAAKVGRGGYQGPRGGYGYNGPRGGWNSNSNSSSHSSSFGNGMSYGNSSSRAGSYGNGYGKSNSYSNSSSYSYSNSNGGFNAPRPGYGNAPRPGYGNGPRPGHGPRPVMGNGPRPGHHGPGNFGPGFRPRPGHHGIPGNDRYRRPGRGMNLPSYWVNPSFGISNFAFFGLSAPSTGSYWSRYYDDAVLINPRGQVYDYRSNLPWDSYPGSYGPAYSPYTSGYAPSSYPVNYAAGNDYGYGRDDRFAVEEVGYGAGPASGGYRTADYGPTVRADADAYNWNDGNVAFAGNNGNQYSYDGRWQGNYVDPDARVFDGQWTGRVIRNGPDTAGGAGYRVAESVPYGSGYDARGAGYGGGEERYYSDDRGGGYSTPRGYEGYERCLKSNGVTGAAIGAVVGAVAGNKIAGRGDKLGGSLLGAGLGGIAGAVAEKAISKCRKQLPRDYDAGSGGGYGADYGADYDQGGYQGGGYSNDGYSNGGYTNGGTYQNGGYTQGGNGYPTYQGGGYYYYPQPTAPTTVTVTPGTSTTTTTVTEEIIYETVSVPVKRRPAHRPAVRKWKPKPKAHCHCY